jgi:predicted metalloprotease with PDZ domain
VLAAVAAAIVIVGSSQAEAQLFRFRLRPRVQVAPPVVVTSPAVVATPAIAHPTPYLGFASHFDGVGEHVNAVQYGSAAWRIGLEPGDRILAVNGVPIRYHGHGLQLLQAAAYQGHVTLAIRDWRTGLIANRTLSLASSTIAVTSGSAVVRRGLSPSSILRRLPD